MKLLYAFCILLTINCTAQVQQELRFEHIDENNGLSNNIVKTIFCDSRGFMWFGTDDGLNMYEGASCNILRHSNTDSNSITGNTINAITEDSKKNIWVSSLCSGLSRLNPFNKKSTNFYAGTDNTSLRSECDIELAFDANKDVWLCNRMAISHLNKDGKTFEHFYPFASAASNIIYRIAISGNSIWFSHSHGLESFDINAKRFIVYDKLVDSSTCGNITVTKEGYLLVCSWLKGLYIVDPVKNKVRHVLNGTITNDAAIINLNGRQQLWVATTEGLYTATLNGDIFSLSDNAFIHYQHNDADAGSLSDNNISCIYTDTTKNKFIWLGTAKGVNKFNPLYLQFHTNLIRKNNLPFSTTSLYNLFSEKTNAGKTQYWLGFWHGSGLLRTDSAFNLLEQITIKDDKGNPMIVSNAIRGKDGYLWIATWNGLYCYDDKKNEILHIYNKTNKSHIQLSTNYLDYVLQDDKGRFWIGTYGRGLNLVNFADSTVHVFTESAEPNSLSDNRTDLIFEDSQKRIWIAGYSLQQYDEDLNNFINYAPTLGDPHSIAGRVNYMFEDSKGKLWAATTGGLCWFDEHQKNFHVLTSKDGLPGDYCEAITEDDHNNLWVTTSGGLCSINTIDYSIKSYTTSDGLPTNQLGSVIAKDGRGNIFFSLDISNSPFISFDPGSLTGSNENVPFGFTGLNILGTEQLFDSSLDDVKTLQLSYKQNVFTVFFKALDYRNTANIRYQCMLNGFNNSWIDLGHNNNVTYTNLDGGAYTLKVRATDASGEWLQKTLQLTIVITPPFWKTWWFYITGVVVVAAVVYFVFRQRVKNIRNEEEKKRAIDNEIADLRLKALKAQMNPHFVFNSLSSIQESILTGKTDAAAKYLGKFSKLIRMVLDFSDAKTITLQQETEYLQLYLELESFRFDNFSFSINVNKDIDMAFTKIPPMLVQPFIENAIKHGLAHKHGNKNLCIDFNETEDERLLVTITDNGIGREASSIINAARQFSHQSKGIKITENRLQLMQEKDATLLTVTDNKDAEGNATGTTVTIQIPLQTTA